MEPILDRRLFRQAPKRARFWNALSVFAVVVILPATLAFALTLKNQPERLAPLAAAASSAKLDAAGAAHTFLQGIGNLFATLTEPLGYASSGSQPAAAAMALAPPPPSLPQPATSTTSQPQPATTVVNNYITNPIEKVVDEEPLASSNFVTQAELAAQLQQLSNTLTAKFSASTSAPVPQYIAAGGSFSYSSAPVVPAINNLSNVAISNPTVTGGSIPASSITGTVTNAINDAAATIASLTGTTLTYDAATFTNATTTNATSTNLYATNLTAGALTVSSTSTLAGLKLSNANCSTYGNGGKLTTDAQGNVTCAADQGGSGSTVGGADTQVQFNSGGSFAGSPSFTFASSTALLTVTNASTTNLTALYASTTHFIASSATSTDLFASLATFTTGVVNALSGTQLTYTAASTTNLSNAGTAYFGGTATSSFNPAGQLTLANLASAILGVNASGQVVATSTIGWNLLKGPASSIFAFDASGNPAATTSIGVNYLTGTLPVGNGGTGTSTPAAYGNVLAWNGSNYQAIATSTLGLAVSSFASHNVSQWTNDAGYLTSLSGAASSTLLSDNNTFSGNDTFTNLITGSITGNAGTATKLQTARTINGVSFDGSGNIAVTAASSTLLANNNSWTGLDQFTNASTTLSTISTLWLPNITAGSLAYINGSNQVAAAAASYPLQFSAGSLSLAFGTTTANSFSQLQTLQNGFLSQASSTVVGNFTTTGNGIFGGTLALSGTTGTTTIASGQGFTIGGSQFVLQQGSGNVGIGTSTPAQPLDIAGSNGFGQLRLENAKAQFAFIGVSNSSSQILNDSAGDLDIAANTGAIRFSANSVNHSFGTQMIIDSSGNVGIGTTSPSSILQITQSGTGNNYGALSLLEPSLASGGDVSLKVGNNFSSSGGAINLGYENAATPFGWLTMAGNPVSTFVIQQGGTIGIGTTTAAFNGQPAQMDLAFVSNAGVGLDINDATPQTNGTYLQFRENETLDGSITENGSATVYNTTSDRRVKQNIATTTAGLATLMQIPVDDFNFISDPNKTRVQGFIAQSLLPIYPEAVTTNGDNGIVPLGPSSTPWEVDYGRITPLIVSAVKDIANISSTFEQNLIAWLGSASNGIADLFAQRIHTTEVCVGDTISDPSPVCVTKAQLTALLSQSAAGATPESVSSSAPQNPSATSSISVSPATSTPSTEPPQIKINGNNPAILHVGDTYADLGASITGPNRDLNLGIQTFLNGILTSNIVIDTSSPATDTIDYVATDQTDLTSTSTRTILIEAPSIAPSDTASSTPTANDDASTTTAATTTNAPTSINATSTAN